MKNRPLSFSKGHAPTHTVMHNILKTRAQHQLLMVLCASMPLDLPSLCIIRVSIVNLRLARKFDTWKY